jgi:hypothetical protein
VVHRPAGDADQPTNRRVVDDRATSLFTHLEQLVFHATPNAAEIDRMHAVEFFGTGIRCLRDRTLDARVIEGCVQRPNVETLCSTIAAT